MSYIELEKATSTPGTPSTGFNRIYPKTVSGVTYLYYKDDAGNEYKIGQGLIPGGTTGQVLTKNSATDYDASWANPSVISFSTTVRNTTGSTIPAGSVIYINGATGGVPTVALAQANAESTSARTYGITSAAIANNANGSAVHIGLIENLNTSAFTDGAILYLSPTVPGGMTTTKPSAPDHLVYIGTCLSANPSLGKIEVQIQNGYELQELHNVQIVSVADHQVLKYDSATSLWKNAPAIGTASAPLSYSTSTDTLSIAQANTTTSGYLSSADWNTFNNKQPAGSYITALTGDVTASGPGSATATLANSGVSAGSYQLANISVDAKGRVTSASDGYITTIVNALIFG